MIFNFSQGDRAPLSQFRLFVLSSCLLFASACTTTYPVNPPLAQIDHGGDSYTIQNTVRDSDNTNEALLLLAFSGGGTRAAAFSYGVLKELSETHIGEEGNSRVFPVKSTLLPQFQAAVSLRPTSGCTVTVSLKTSKRSFCAATCRES
jgi:hypothetical protein